MLKTTINLKNKLHEDREMKDIMIEFYPIKRSLIISRQGSVQKGSRILNSIKFKTKYNYSFKYIYSNN